MAIEDHIKRRSDFNETQDYVPTPPFATRALFKYVAPEIVKPKPDNLVAWDPACGGGHMCEVLKEYGFRSVIGSDAYDRGYEPGEVVSFDEADKSADLIATNPPYALLNEFMVEGLNRSDRFLALLVRIQALESQRRYNAVFKNAPPTRIGVFSDRVPFRVNFVTPKARKMFTHCWVFWDKIEMTERTRDDRSSEFMWIPPDAQKMLEKEGDYDV